MTTTLTTTETTNGDARDAFASSSAVGALALETDSAELEADLAEARAAADAGDGDFRGDDATHRVAKSPLERGPGSPELELRLTAHAGLVRALERSVALDEDDDEDAVGGAGDASSSSTRPGGSSRSWRSSRLGSRRGGSWGGCRWTGRVRGARGR